MTNPSDIRSFMEIIDEASLKDLAAGAKEHLKAATGDKKSQGAIESKRLAKHLKKEFQKWMGQTGSEQDEDALLKFLVSKIGFTPANARKIFQSAGVQDPIQSESIMEALNASQLDNVLLKAAQFAYEHDLIPDDDKSDDDGYKTKGKFNKSGTPGYGYGNGGYGRGRARDYGTESLNDIVKNLTGDEKTAFERVMQKVKSQANLADIDEEHFAELIAALAKSKKYQDIRNFKEYEDVHEQLARIGFSYLKAYVSAK